MAEQEINDFKKSPKLRLYVMMVIGAVLLMVISGVSGYFVGQLIHKKCSSPKLGFTVVE